MSHNPPQPINEAELRERITTEIYLVHHEAVQYRNHTVAAVDAILKAAQDAYAPAIAATEKAYGGCHNCYGKGYASYQGTYAGGGMIWPDKSIRYCTCERGKQLEGVVAEAERVARLDELDLLPDCSTIEQLEEHYHRRLDDLATPKEPPHEQ